MATFPPTKEARDENLDKLEQAGKEWADKEKTRLEDETKYLRAVVKGRGANEAGTANLSLASNLLVQAVTDFVIFSEKMG